MTSSLASQQSLQDEIADLERRLLDARAQLNQQQSVSVPPTADHRLALHALLLLSDSALPLGSFAFSSGLESYLAHHKLSPPSASQLPLFNTFLRLSLSTLASTALPYVLAGYRNPEDIETLDNDFDASTPCTVARRASIAQGRALLAVWDRSFKAQYKTSTGNAEGRDKDECIEALIAFSATLRTSPDANAHYAPLWGLVTRILAVPLHEAAYLFLFSHARTVMSAAVRASVMGPYQAQALLASTDLQDRIRGLVDEGWERSVEDAGQSVPVMDLWSFSRTLSSDRQHLAKHSPKMFLTRWVSWLVTTQMPNRSLDVTNPHVLDFADLSWIRSMASIGDSYAAGLGSGDRVDFSCSRYSSAYANIIHKSLRMYGWNTTHQSLACSGADTSEIMAKQIPTLNNTNFGLITISAGGNDIGLTPILGNCVYQFYMAGKDACHNVTSLLEATKPHLNSTHGLIYVTGYARFFGTEDNTCDNVTWAVWRNIGQTKQYLKLEMRETLNEMVLAVNKVLRRAVEAAGPNVHFIDYDARIAMLQGRYCELGVYEPDPNRPGLMFYEWDTVDRGENKTDLQNSTGDGVPKGSFESGIAEQINRTLHEHPDWSFDPEKGFVRKNETQVGGEGIIGDTIGWLIPDSYKRVFHLRPAAHWIVSGMIWNDLKTRALVETKPSEVEEL
ncbi:hypothetical protein OPT61_g1892 [Boeremia exigua]|uniref:Uncharacterized protein n=1 Tax=Boeremia exigua TaxID=749465 RepID=A0ACC2INQ2_9PLEO|nr:hypothetical protein OPT61_g1892 [Boeremia exigua]